MTAHPPPPWQPGPDYRPRHGHGPAPTSEYDEAEPHPHGSAPDRDLGHGHGHGLGHSHEPPAGSVSARTRRIVLAILVPAALATLAGVFLLWPSAMPDPPAEPEGVRAYGEVLAVQAQQCPADPRQPAAEPDPSLLCGTASVRITDGPGKQTTVTVDLPRGPGAPQLRPGDEVILNHQADAPAGLNQYAVTDHQRGRPMVFMLALAAAIVVAFGRWRGLTALLGLGVSFAVLLWFIIPAILGGEPPLLVAIVGSAAIMFAVLYLTHGINVHTSVAVLGTLLSLVLTGVLGALFTAAMKLTGFGSEESLYLAMLQQDVDVRGLLLAGIIIGALGVLDDVTVTQSSTVAELARSATSRLDLYRSATRIGRAHVASAVNTIVLAYAGSSLSLLLLVAAGGRAVSDLLTSPFLAQEILRSAIGTMGLVAAVPITTGLASLVADLGGRRRTRRPSATADHQPGRPSGDNHPSPARPRGRW
ncbi:MAG TPA: YibE/F family protein [Micromonosporaceae bacterium]